MAVTRSLFHTMISIVSKIRLGSLVALQFFVLAVSPAFAAKNVIIMISDGAGYNSWLAASMYQGRVGKQVYDQPGWVTVSSTTYPLTRSEKPTGNLEQDKTLVYDPFKAWDATRIGAKPEECCGYDYLKNTPTDSAAAATAMATGQKTYNSAINWTNEDEPMSGENIAEIAKSRGQGDGRHHHGAVEPRHAGRIRRCAQCEPEQLRRTRQRDALRSVAGRDHGRGQSRFRRRRGSQKTSEKRRLHLRRREADVVAVEKRPPPGRLEVDRKQGGVREAGRRQRSCAAETSRNGPGGDRRCRKSGITAMRRSRATKKVQRQPYELPFNANVPSLAVMSKAAIRALERNPKGFYLMIEGGAVDWANHANQPERLIEEQIDFVQAVEAVVAWVEKNSNWDDTLLILSADHECGHLWGPDSDKIPFQPLDR